MKTEWQRGDEGGAEAFNVLPLAEKQRLAAEMERRLEFNTEKVRAETAALARRNQLLRELLERRHQFLARLEAV